ncbi:hypothetical protein C8F01DRAFT_1077163 [Mycena amicta]|nr:hypothetical protein C8F01DRAFT_1077163 [Mycena amicta]
MDTILGAASGFEPSGSGLRSWETTQSLAQDHRSVTLRLTPAVSQSKRQVPPSALVLYLSKLTVLSAVRRSDDDSHPESVSMSAEIDRLAIASSQDRPVLLQDVLRSLEEKAGIQDGIRKIRANTPLFLPSPWSEPGSVTSESPAKTPLFLPWSDTASVASDSPRFLFPSWSDTASFSSKAQTVVETDTRKTVADADSEPPRKKARYTPPSRVSRYLDVAAVEVDGDEGEDVTDDEDGGFIDDEACHDFGPQNRFPPPPPDELRDFAPEAEEARQIAQYYEDQARAARQVRQATLQPVTFDAKLRANNELKTPVVATPEAPPMFAIRTPRDRELLLIKYLVGCGIVISAGTMGLGSQLVFAEVEAGYVEVDADTQQRWGIKAFTPIHALTVALESWASTYRMRWEHRTPIEIPPAERHRLLCPPGHPDFYDPFGATNRWARLKTGRYRGDIAFIEGQVTSTAPETLLVVPRIPYDDDDPNAPPPRLFDPNRFLGANPTAGLEKRNQIWLWTDTDRVFGGKSFPGLEQISNPYKPYERQRYDVSAVPTEDELDLFRATGASELDVPFTGFTSALQEGDRVYLTHSSAQLPWGMKNSAVILGIVPQTIDNHRVRMAVLVAEYDGQSLTSPGVLTDLLKQAFWTSTGDLKLHILAFRRQIRVGDRVQLVLGEHCGVYARVKKSYRDTLWLQPVDAPHELQVSLRQVSVVFECGDVVRVIRGIHKGKIGLVVSVELGGYCTFYPAYQAEINEGRFVFVPAERVDVPGNPRKITMVIQRDEDSQVTPTYRIPTNHIVFEHFDSSDVQLRTTDSAQGEHAWITLQRKQRQVRADMTDGFDWVRHKEIRIVGKEHPMKGRDGQVMDYKWTAPPTVVKAALKEERMERYLQLVVGLAMSNTSTEVMYRNVRHKGTGLPLEQAHMLTSVRDGCFFEQVYLPVQKAGEVVVRRVHLLYGSPPKLEEARWLLHPEFIGKRIDLQVGSKEDFSAVMRGYGKLASKIKDKQISLAGQVGWLLPLTDPVSEVQRANNLFPFIAPSGTVQRVNMPLPVLKPVHRTNDNKRSIAEVSDRVVIIGPDVNGNPYRIGQYAEVVPGKTEYPKILVRVRFPRERTENGHLERVEAIYWLEALCRSINQPIDGAAATDFDAIPV